MRPCLPALLSGNNMERNEVVVGRFNQISSDSGGLNS